VGKLRGNGSAALATGEKSDKRKSYASFWICEALLAVLELFGRLQKSLGKQLPENRLHNFRRYEQLFRDKLY